ncbi:MAG: hypothetical protein JSS09_05285 [Verrucomicrobia bacterium]|nr:hypothetical protein [Verrucomicrobiota bacterium]
MRISNKTPFFPLNNSRPTTLNPIVVLKKHNEIFLQNSLGNLENKNIVPYENDSDKPLKTFKKHSFSDKK